MTKTLKCMALPTFVGNMVESIGDYMSLLAKIQMNGSSHVFKISHDFIISNFRY